MIARGAAVVSAILLASAGAARADWPCAGEDVARIVRGARGAKPIAIATATTRAVYGAFAPVDLNADGRGDLVFTSACFEDAGEKLRLHRIYASCGKNPFRDDEDFVLLFEREEPCARTVSLAPGKAARAPGWRPLTLTVTTPVGRCRERATWAVTWTGARYDTGTATRTSCPAPAPTAR